MTNLQLTYIRLSGTAAFQAFRVIYLSHFEYRGYISICQVNPYNFKIQEYLMPRLNGVITFLGLEQPLNEKGNL